MLDHLDLLLAVRGLGISLAIGLFVGLERGWRAREVREGGRVAGLRTFALIGLMGGLLSLVGSGSASALALLLAVGLACVAILFAVAFKRSMSATGTVSITTGIAALVTFSLGALATQGQEIVAVAAAVVVTLLLGMKEQLHDGLRRIQPEELHAVLQLAVLSAAILPFLPDEGLGPYGALNPFRIWLAVILVAALALAGHVAVRLRGQQQGLMWVGLLGGLASSTAATVALARAVRDEPALVPSGVPAIVAASGVMFLRMAVVVALLQPSLAVRLGGFLSSLGIACFVVAWGLWRRRAPSQAGSLDTQAKLFGLSTALGFGLTLGLVAIASQAGRAYLGDAGLFGVAFIAGLADVDAIVLSSVQMHAQGDLAAGMTAAVMLTAALSNMVMKASMAWTIAGRAVGVQVSIGYVVALLAGAALAGLVAMLN